MRINNELDRLMEQRGLRARLVMRILNPLGWEQELLELQASPQPCDIFSIPAGAYPIWVEQGALLSFEDNKSISNGISLAQAAPALWLGLPRVVWSAMEQDGALYAIPNLDTQSIAGGISIRLDVVEALALAAQMEALKSYLEVTPLLDSINQAILVGTLQEHGVAGAENILRVFGRADMHHPILAGYQALAMPLVVRYDDAGLHVQNWYQTLEFQELASLRAAWQEKGYGPSRPLTPEEVLNGYTEGRFVVELGRPVRAAGVLDRQIRYGHEWIDRAISPSFLTDQRITSLTVLHAGLIKDPDRARRVLHFLDWAYTDATPYLALVYGLEGEDWRWMDGKPGRVERLPGAAYRPDFVGQVGILREDGATEWPTQLEFSSTFGFRMDPRPVGAEQATIQGILLELEAPMAQGQVEDIPAWTARVLEKLKQAGLEQVQAELDRQLAEWQAQRSAP